MKRIREFLAAHSREITGGFQILNGGNLYGLF